MARWVNAVAKLTGGNVEINSGEITNDSFSTTAADALDCDKVQQFMNKGTNFGFVIGGTPTTREEIVHVATFAGTFRGFHAMLNDTGTTTSIAFDLKKNGTTVLSGAVTITHGTSDRAVVDGTLSVPTFAADDVISIAMTVSASTAAQGPYAFVVLEENNAGT